MFRDRSRIRKVAIVEYGAEMLPKRVLKRETTRLETTQVTIFLLYS